MARAQVPAKRRDEYGMFDAILQLEADAKLDSGDALAPARMALECLSLANDELVCGSGSWYIASRFIRQAARAVQESGANGLPNELRASLRASTEKALENAPPGGLVARLIQQAHRRHASDLRTGSERHTREYRENRHAELERLPPWYDQVELALQSPSLKEVEARLAELDATYRDHSDHHDRRVAKLASRLQDEQELRSLLADLLEGLDAH